MITAILFFGIPLLILFAVIAIAVWFFFRRQKVERKPLISPLQDDKNTTNQPRIEPTVTPAPTPQQNQTQQTIQSVIPTPALSQNKVEQTIKWGEWQLNQWNDEKLNGMGLARCAQIRKMDPKNFHLIDAAIIIKAYGLTTPYGAELDETAIENDVYGGGAYGISIKINLNAQENWRKIQTALELQNLTVKPRKANDRVHFNSPTHKTALDEDTFTETEKNKVIATIESTTFQQKTLELFSQKLADSGKYKFSAPLMTEPTTAYKTLCQNIAALLLLPEVGLNLKRLQTEHTKSTIIPTLAINQLLGCLVYYRNDYSSQIQPLLNTYRIFPSDENFLSQLYTKWDTKNKLDFIRTTLKPLPKRISDAMHSDYPRDPKDILGHLLFLAHHTKETTPDAVNQCVLAFNQTFRAHLSASELYSAHRNKIVLAHANRGDFLANPIKIKIKETYFVNKNPAGITLFLHELEKKLRPLMKVLPWDNMKHLELSTIVDGMFEEVNRSPSNPNTPTLAQIFNATFEKFAKNQHRFNQEIHNDLDRIAATLKMAIELNLKEKEEKISKALKELDTQLAAQLPGSETTSTATTSSTATTTNKMW